MITTVGLAISKTSRGERLEGSSHNEIDYMRFRMTYISEVDGLSWWWFALSECF